MLLPVADGVIVGSALVRKLEPAGKSMDAIIGEVVELARSLAAALNE